MPPSIKHAKLLVIASESVPLVPLLRRFGFHRITTLTDFVDAVAQRDAMRPDIVLCDARQIRGDSASALAQSLVELKSRGSAVLILGSAPILGAHDAAQVLEEPFDDSDLLRRLTDMITAQCARFESESRRQIMEARRRELRRQFEQLLFRDLYARSLAFEEAVRQEASDRVECVVALLAAEFAVRPYNRSTPFA